MGAAHFVRGKVRRNGSDFDVLQQNVEILRFCAGLKDAVHFDCGLFQCATFTYGAVQNGGCLVEVFDYHNRAMNARTGVDIQYPYI